MSASAATSVDRALWPLALLAGLLPLVATAIAYFMSTRMGLVPECNPFFEGCVSISRAARHDLPNILFRALLLPLLGLANVFLPLWWPGPAFKDAVENITEWWGGAIFTAFFLLLACAWRSTGLRMIVRC